MTEEQITIDDVIKWNLGPASGFPAVITSAAEQIEQSMEAAAKAVQESGPYFEGSAGDALRTAFADDRKDCLITVDILNDLAQAVTSVTSTFKSRQQSIKDVVSDIEDSEYDLFYTGDGDVESRKSNWELLLKGPGAVAAKTFQAQFYQTQLRVHLSRIAEADQSAQASMGTLLERLPNSVREALVSMPTDPVLRDIMTKYQVDGSEELVVFPSGTLLDLIRTVNPSVEPKAMSEGEAAALTALAMQPDGLTKIKTFYDVQEEAQTAASEAYAGLGEEKSNTSWSDGHADAFRHAYWNARMTQEFGPEWTESFTTSHEKVGGNPAAREAMDLYNNQLGRTIGADNMDASPEELGAKVQAAIDGNQAIVLGGTPENPQIAFSNSVAPGTNTTQPGAGIPMPK
ncbi:DUF6973 domain-containing protein [Nocardia asteroides]|uniref:DUF6973 domain-containing protein n=1 Tax=Nocardia asteroides TaxID=1824 RepID=UPI001E60D478|nr:hypothetical protein [Nocardia asteroides]UGT57562.1 hypothetical protein LTT85_12285 [Nocardia asteroides]